MEHKSSLLFLIKEMHIGIIHIKNKIVHAYRLDDKFIKGNKSKIRFFALGFFLLLISSKLV